MNVPFMNLDAQIQALEPELRAAVDDVIKHKSFIQGPWVERFNKAFLELHGGRFGVGCANGTSAITVSLRALNIGPGDEVLIPNHTFFGTAEPVVEVGARPILVDIDETWRQLDLNDAASKVTSRTKAIIPVHLYGMPEPMTEIMAFAQKHGLRVIEDCAQAHLAKWDGKPVGTFGDLGTFSFYPGKNLGAFGDAGFIVTGDAKLFDFVSRYINHGRKDKYVHEFFGTNVRMDGMQGAVLSVKLGKMKEWTERRRELARAFDEVLIPRGFRVLKPRPQAEAVYHLYVVEVSNRDELLEQLPKAGVGCLVHYPVPLSRQPAFASYGYKSGQLPVSERMSERILSLAFFPEMTPEQTRFVLNTFTRLARP